MQMQAAVRLTLAMFLSVCAFSQTPKKVQTREVQGHSFSPASKTFDQAYLKQLKVPAGFEVTAWATHIGHPRMMAVADDGTVYVTRYEEDDVIALRDQNGKASPPKTVAKLGKVHGIALQGKKVWLTTVHDLYTADVGADGSFSQPKKLMDTLGDGGQHDKRTIGIGPDNLLYISIGSTCNTCDDPADEKAVIWRTKLDGSGREVFAKGLRNTIGFGWHPETKEMWGMDHGIDWGGDDYPREELNKLTQGSDYGWPFCSDERIVNTTYAQNPKGTTKEEYCKKTVPSTLTYTAHAAPIWMLFYIRDMFPPEYKNDALVAMHGSWNRRPASGYEVVRIKFDHGKPVKFEPFLTGFLATDGKSQFGRPAGLAVMKDGSLLVSDDDSGVIYRVAYKK